MNIFEQAEKLPTNKLIEQLRNGSTMEIGASLMELGKRSAQDESLLEIVKDTAAKKFNIVVYPNINLTIFALVGLLEADTLESRALYSELLMLWDKTQRADIDRRAKAEVHSGVFALA